MNNFVILRVKKIKNMAGIAASARHNFREQKTLNADEKKTNQNLSAGAVGSAAVTKKLKERLNTQGKIRSNAVLALEYVITASPEAFNEFSRKQQIQYFKDSLSFLKNKHQDLNVISASIHFDETTPHLHCLVCPISKNGKLSARDFVGGRHKLNQLQSDFAQLVGSKHGLKRGVEGSKAKNQSLKKFYGHVSKIDDRVNELPTKKDYLMAAGGKESESIAQLKQASEQASAYAIKVKTLNDLLKTQQISESILKTKLIELENELRASQERINELGNHYHPSIVKNLQSELSESRKELTNVKKQALSLKNKIIEEKLKNEQQSFGSERSNRTEQYKANNL